MIETTRPDEVLIAEGFRSAAEVRCYYTSAREHPDVIRQARAALGATERAVVWSTARLRPRILPKPIQGGFHRWHY